MLIRVLKRNYENEKIGFNRTHLWLIKTDYISTNYVFYWEMPAALFFSQETINVSLEHN